MQARVGNPLPETCLIGNVDPAGILYFGKPEDVIDKANEAIEKAGGSCEVVAL